jgi:glycosyltransferase involved in cell wall biosynthesis
VSESIRKIFNNKYNTDFQVIRNIAVFEDHGEIPIKEEKYLVYIGAVNEGRGLEQVIEAMKFIDSKLYICGDGDILNELIAFAHQLGVEEKVFFLGYVEPENLKRITRNAYLGFLLLNSDSQSYYYSLANKFFDYIHAGIPQITIDFPEYRFINEEYKVAELISLKVEEIVMATNRLLFDKEYYQELATNCILARNEYNWQKESLHLLEIYKAV